MRTPTGSFVLVCRVDSSFCALAAEHVGETMRPLPIAPLAGMPPFVLGVARIRGLPTPVVDARHLLRGTPAPAPARFVTLKLPSPAAPPSPGGSAAIRTATDASPRRAALAVDEVIGLRTLRDDTWRDLPPLLQESGSEAVECIAALDAHLLWVLRAGRLVPNAVWAGLEEGPTA